MVIPLVFISAFRLNPPRPLSGRFQHLKHVIEGDGLIVVEWRADPQNCRCRFTVVGAGCGCCGDASRGVRDGCSLRLGDRRQRARELGRGGAATRGHSAGAAWSLWVATARAQVAWAGGRRTRRPWAVSEVHSETLPALIIGPSNTFTIKRAGAFEDEPIKQQETITLHVSSKYGGSMNVSNFRALSSFTGMVHKQEGCTILSYPVSAPATILL
jgi:hypothetical protein